MNSIKSNEYEHRFGLILINYDLSDSVSKTVLNLQLDRISTAYSIIMSMQDK